jgi:undecaprenyl-diphosphatase
MLLGLRGPAAFRFSFLLSLPAVGGAVLLEAIGGDGVRALPGTAWLGVAAAFGVGLLALSLLRRSVASGRLWVFALYLVALAAAVLITTA